VRSVTFEILGARFSGSWNTANDAQLSHNRSNEKRRSGKHVPIKDYEEIMFRVLSAEIITSLRGKGEEQGWRRLKLLQQPKRKRGKRLFLTVCLSM
jgi:hypothetical protein